MLVDTVDHGTFEVGVEAFVEDALADQDGEDGDAAFAAGEGGVVPGGAVSCEDGFFCVGGSDPMGELVGQVGFGKGGSFRCRS